MTEIGTLNHSNAPATISILDTYEIQLNKRWSASSRKWTDCNGMVGIVVPFADIKDKVVRFTGFTKGMTTSDSNAARWYGKRLDDSCISGFFVSSYSGNGTDDLWNSYVVDEGDGTYSIAVNATNIAKYTEATVVNIAMNMVVNNTGTAITSADLANFSMIIADE